jgi:uncharacterized DUF497 family protein
MSLQFEWDRHKAGSNLRKHKVSFDEATTVFDDPLANIFDDEDHSVAEHREIIVGQSLLRRLLVVCFTERLKHVIRIFSARPATRREQNDYEENTGYQIT